MKKCTIVLLAAVLLVSPLAAAAEPVAFTDPNLKSIVEKTLGLADPTPDDMLKLTRLYAGSQGIADLAGLEHAKNLNSLCLHRNKIADLTPVANLTQLTYLCLHDNAIEDVAPVKNLTATVNLLVYGNKITDLSPVAGLAELTSLYANNNRLTDLAPVANLKKLRFLDASNNQIADVSAAAGLTDLTDLRLSGNQIADLAPIANLDRLKSVWAFDNPAPIPAKWLTNEITVYLDSTQYAKSAPEAPKGKLACRGDIDSFMITRGNCFVRVNASPDGVDLPVGDYRLSGWEIEKKDAQGILWKMTAASRAQDKGAFAIADAQTTTLDVGEPVVASITAKKSRSGYTFGQSLAGRMGESIAIAREGNRTAPPQLHIANKDKTFDKTFSFEYG